jgi:selenocysteine lyase/cysteine desulfurase
MSAIVRSFSAKSIEAIRKEFPMLQREINRKPIVYFDNAALNEFLKGPH